MLARVQQSIAGLSIGDTIRIEAHTPSCIPHTCTRVEAMAQLFLSSKGQACRALACSDPTNSQWLAGGGGAQWGWITSIVGAWVHGIHHPLVRLEGWMACSNGNGNGNDPETASDRYGAWSVRRGEASIPFASLRFFSRLPLFPSPRDRGDESNHERRCGA